jgi:phage gpG-like protein
MAGVDITDNSAEVRAALEQAKARALEIIGGKAESYAKGLVAPLGPKGNPMRSDITAQVRNSIEHRVDGDTVLVGSNLDFAAYVELGTGNKYEPSADWIETTVKKGPNSGLSKWFFFDEEQGRVRIGLPMSPTPFLRPAVENHLDEYKNVIDKELTNA